MATTEDTRKDRKRRYEQVLTAVERNTSPKQPFGVPAHALWTTLISHGSMDAGDARSHVRAAVENDDLVTWTDADDTVWYVRGTDEYLKKAIGKLNQRDEPPVDVIKHLAGHIGGER